MKVFFAGGGTGGHLYPGLAIARALVRVRPDVQPHFIGALRGIEKHVLPRTEFPFTLLDLHPLYRSRVWENWRTLRGGITAWRAVGKLAREERPAMVVGTGGYASGVALAWARRHHTPIVQHIGDAFPGIVARRCAGWCVECYLGFPEAMERLPKTGATEYVVTGNPIEPPPTQRPDRAKLLKQWGFAPDARVLLVFGGSQGSLTLNEIVAAWTAQALPAGWSVILATGTRNYDRFRSFDNPRVRVVPYLAPIADAYAVADIGLVRGGMMGTAELCAWGIPMIIVPLPTAAADHQTWNAKSLEAAGAAVHLAQRDLTVERLSAVFTALVSDPKRLASVATAARARAHPTAAADIARRIAARLPT